MVSEEIENQEEIMTSSDVWLQFFKFKGQRGAWKKNEEERKKKINPRHIGINCYDFGGA